MAKTVGNCLVAYISSSCPSQWDDRLRERFSVEGMSEYQTETITKKQWEHFIPLNERFFEKHGLTPANRHVVQRFVEALSCYKYCVKNVLATPLSDEMCDLIVAHSNNEVEAGRRLLLAQNLIGITEAANNMAKVMGGRGAYMMGRALIREWNARMERVMDKVLDDMQPILRKQNLYNFKRVPLPELREAVLDDSAHDDIVKEIAETMIGYCEKRRNAMAALGLFPSEATPLPVMDDIALLHRIEDASEEAADLYTHLATRDSFALEKDPELCLPMIAEVKERLSALVGASMVRQLMTDVENIVDKKINFLRRTGGTNLDLGDLPPERGR